MSKDLRDPQKLGERMLHDVESVRDAFGTGVTLSGLYDDHIARFANSYFPVVAEADGIYVGPLQRYGDPRA